MRIHRLIILALACLLLAGAASLAQASAAGKKVVLVVPFNDYQEKELNDIREELEEAGVLVTVASTMIGTASGMSGGSSSTDMVLADVSAGDFDAVCFIGGSGVQGLWNDAQAQRIAREFYEAGKVTAAICWAPVILATSGILDGREATVADGGGAVNIMERHGCDVSRSSLVVDGLLMTANGPRKADDLGEEMVEALGGEE